MKTRPHIFVFVALLLGFTAVQSQQPAANPTAVVRLRVRVRADDSSPLRGLSRKRFFLISGSLEQNRTLIEAIEQQPVSTRDCYYKKLGASAALINWLKEGDCESVYCRSIEKDFAVGAKAVPEFASAFALSQKEVASEETALQWLTTNMTPDLRDGFYRDRQRVVETLLKHAQTLPVTIQSVMTDRNGTAFFTDLGPGTYVLSNFIPAELGQNLVSWNCEVQVKVEDLAAEKPYLVSNRKDKLVKCVGLEKPIPVCAAN
jgi:hypothetical protein